MTLADGVLDAWDLNERTNRMLIENLSDAAWRADPPGGKGRTIAAIWRTSTTCATCG